MTNHSDITTTTTKGPFMKRITSLRGNRVLAGALAGLVAVTTLIGGAAPTSQAQAGDPAPAETTGELTANFYSLGDEAMPSGSRFDYSLELACSSTQAEGSCDDIIVEIPIDADLPQLEGATKMPDWTWGASPADATIRPTVTVTDDVVRLEFPRALQPGESTSVRLEATPPNFTTPDDTSWTLRPEVTSAALAEPLLAPAVTRTATAQPWVQVRKLMSNGRETQTLDPSQTSFFQFRFEIGRPGHGTGQLAPGSGEIVFRDELPEGIEYTHHTFRLPFDDPARMPEGVYTYDPSTRVFEARWPASEWRKVAQHYIEIHYTIDQDVADGEVIPNTGEFSLTPLGEGLQTSESTARLVVRKFSLGAPLGDKSATGNVRNYLNDGSRLLSPELTAQCGGSCTTIGEILPEDRSAQYVIHHHSQTLATDSWITDNIPCADTPLPDGAGFESAPAGELCENPAFRVTELNTSDPTKLRSPLEFRLTFADGTVREWQTHVAEPYPLDPAWGDLVRIESKAQLPDSATLGRVTYEVKGWIPGDIGAEPGMIIRNRIQIAQSLPGGEPDTITERFADLELIPGPVVTAMKREGVYDLGQQKWQATGHFYYNGFFTPLGAEMSEAKFVLGRYPEGITGGAIGDSPYPHERFSLDDGGSLFLRGGAKIPGHRAFHNDQVSVDTHVDPAVVEPGYYRIPVYLGFDGYTAEQVNGAGMCDVASADLGYAERLGDLDPQAAQVAGIDPDTAVCVYEYSVLVVGPTPEVSLTKEMSIESGPYRFASDTPVLLPDEPVSVTYRLTMANVGPKELDELVMYDLLPAPGDAGLVPGVGLRGSSGRVELVAAPAPPAGWTVSYSTSDNPCRPELDPALTDCVDDWSTTAPADLAEVTALRFTGDEGTTLDLGERAEATLEVRTDPLAIGETAWNSVAGDATVVGVPGTVLPVEAPKVGVTLPGSASIRVVKHLDDTSEPGQSPTGLTEHGQDSDANTEPVLSNGTVATKYVITNTGGRDLHDVVLTGPESGDVSCDIPGGVLRPGQTVICEGPDETLPADVAVYSTPVTVTGTTRTMDGEVGDTVSDEAPALAIMAAPALEIVKAAPEAVDGMRTGTEVRWTYTVTNTGNAPVSDIRVVDDQGVAVTLLTPPDGSTADEWDGVLQPGQTVVYEGTGPVTAQEPAP